MLRYLCSVVAPVLLGFTLGDPDVDALPSPSPTPSRCGPVAKGSWPLGPLAFRLSSWLTSNLTSLFHASALVLLVDGPSPLGYWTPTPLRYRSRDIGFGARFFPRTILLHFRLFRLHCAALCITVRRYPTILTRVCGRRQVPSKYCSSGLPTLALCHVPTRRRRHSITTTSSTLWVAHVGAVPRAHTSSSPSRHYHHHHLSSSEDSDLDPPPPLPPGRWSLARFPPPPPHPISLTRCYQRGGILCR